MAQPTKSWCKHAFNYYSKCDVLVNDLDKSFNATILISRDKPFLTLCGWITNYLMNRISTSRFKLDKCHPTIDTRSISFVIKPFHLLSSVIIVLRRRRSSSSTLFLLRNPFHCVLPILQIRIYGIRLFWGLV